MASQGMGAGSPAEAVPAKKTRDWLTVVLFAFALAYAALAGLRTVTEYDLGWQMATGRWIVQHHQIPSTDVFSYTAQGQPWIYPVGAGLLFYALFLVGSYTLLSWSGVAACVAAVALLLRRGNAVTAALVIFAIPMIAPRTSPRAEMFTVILFSAFLALLLEHLQGGKAPLWLLPALMVAWVNLHLGFVAGFALLGGYVAIELLELPFAGERQSRSIERLRRAAPWVAATIPATLVNPWGWNLYAALVRQNHAMAQHAQWISEWARRPWNWNAISANLSIHGSQGILICLLALSMIVVLLAVVRRQLGFAVLLAGAAYGAVQHKRFEALFACVAVAVTSVVINSIWPYVTSRWRDVRMRRILATGAVVAFAMLASVRAFDLVTNRHYLGSSELATFGTGLAWWCPERAAAFIEREHLPAQIFNNYNTGGFLVWSLGGHYQDYLDGRAIPFGPEIFERQTQLMQADPDGPLWRREADRNGINVILLSLARYDGDIPALAKFCASRSWKPVYLDEVSAVLLRSTAGNDALIQRFGIDCDKVALPPLPAGLDRAQVFHYWANAATVLFALRRYGEAWTASSQALAVFPANAQVHFLRGSLLNAAGNLGGAEQEYRTALALEPNDVLWSSLAAIYRRQGKLAEAQEATRNSLALSSRPHLQLIDMAFADIVQKHPREALDAVEEALRRAPREAASNRQFQVDVRRARAAALNLLGDSSQAIALETQAVQLMPESADLWRELGDLYALNGRDGEAQRARETAARLDSASN